jgi:hypothetical protein
MNPVFTLPEATTHAVQVDHIFYGLLVLSGLTMLLVFVLVIFLAVRNRLDLRHAVPVCVSVLVGVIRRPQESRRPGRRD